MPWKTSRHGHRYYCVNRRRGDRVISEYMGTGPVAELECAPSALLRRAAG